MTAAWPTPKSFLVKGIFLDSEWEAKNDGQRGCCQRAFNSAFGGGDPCSLWLDSTVLLNLGRFSWKIVDRLGFLLVALGRHSSYGSL